MIKSEEGGREAIPNITQTMETRRIDTILDKRTNKHTKVTWNPACYCGWRHGDACNSKAALLLCHWNVWAGCHCAVLFVIEKVFKTDGCCLCKSGIQVDTHVWISVVDLQTDNSFLPSVSVAPSYPYIFFVLQDPNRHDDHKLLKCLKHAGDQ